MLQLENKVSLITGASAGIGRAAATLFAREGAAVVLGARRGDALAEVAREIEGKGGRAAVLAGDVRDEGFAAGLVALALERFGGLDIALNNAGALGALGPAESLSPAAVRETLEVNLLSAFAAVRHQAAPMLARGGGSMIFTSSFVGHTVGMPGMAAYAASKAGLVGLAKVLAAEYGPRGLRVNALLPGGTDTDMATEFADDPQKRAFVENLFALKRIAAPEEIAKAALFLASDAASFVTGTAFLADGGVSINRT